MPSSRRDLRQALGLMLLLCLLVISFPGPLQAQEANLTGSWVFNVTTDAGSGDPRFELKQDGTKLSGKYSGQLGEADVTGVVEGKRFRLEFTLSMGGEAKVIYEGSIESPTSLKGTVDLAGQATGTFTATRK
ncbi:MAG: hypothetical protein MUF01_03515 [Bryobacterales bacterium]|nr:hypothetical protein [Bryobacterales bacterium]